MNIQEKEITVVIPVYNGEKTIRKTLDSICGQTAPQYIREIIVVNDGSRDGTAAAVRAYAEGAALPIRLIEKENGGVSSARNKGMALAETPWIALCDADDAWLPDKIERQTAIINGNEIDLLGGAHREGTLRILFRTVRSLYRGTVKDLCYASFPQTSTVLMRRRIFEEIGGFDENQRYAEDGNYLMKIAAKYRYYYDPALVVFYGEGKRGFGQTGLSGNMKGMHRGVLKNLKEMRGLGYIGLGTYLTAWAYEQVKYLRRLLIALPDARRTAQGR